MVETISDIDSFSKLKDTWIRLEREPCMRIFQTYQWCRAAWDLVLSTNPDNKLFILHWRRGEESVILPTYLDKKGILRFIADDDSDVCDAVYGNGENHHIAYREMAKIILQDNRIKGVWFQKLYGESEACNYFGVVLPGAFVARDNAFSWLEVKSSDDFIASQTHMPSKDRADLKGLLRSVKKYSLVVKSKDNGDMFPRKALLSLREDMRQRKIRDKSYLDDRQVAFVETIYENGGCYIALLFDEDSVVAANVLLKKDYRVLSWVFLYTNPRMSSALYVKYLSEIKHGRDYIFDFGVGVYSYKIGTFRPKMGITVSLRYGKSNIKQFIALILTNVRFLKDWVKAIYGKGH